MGYIKTNRGFISNAPQIQFERCDGRRFFSNTGSAASMNSSDNTNPVYGGWGKTPIGYVDGDSTFEISFTDAMFYEDMYYIASTGEAMYAASKEIVEAHQITSVGMYSEVVLLNQAEPSSIKIPGLTRTTSQIYIPADKFYINTTGDDAYQLIFLNDTAFPYGTDVTVTYVKKGDQYDTSVMGGGMYGVEMFTDTQAHVTYGRIPLHFEANTSTIQVHGFELSSSGSLPEQGSFRAFYNQTEKTTWQIFNKNDVSGGEQMLVTYERRVARPDIKTITTNAGTARGSLTLTWPVMSSGDDCTQAAILGLYHLTVPRVMVSQRPNLDTSRSSAATPQITFSAVDAHKGDNTWYRLTYEELDGGVIGTDYTGDIIWD